MKKYMKPAMTIAEIELQKMIAASIEISSDALDPNKAETRDGLLWDDDEF